MIDQFQNTTKALLVAGVLALSAHAAHAQSAEQKSAVQSVIESQLNAFRTKEHDKAFSYAAPQLQKIFGSTDRFINMVQNGYGAIYGARGWQFGRSKMEGETLLQELRLTGPNGNDWVAIYTMRQQADGTWRIAGVQMTKADGLST